METVLIALSYPTKVEEDPCLFFVPKHLYDGKLIEAIDTYLCNAKVSLNEYIAAQIGYYFLKREDFVCKVPFKMANSHEDAKRLVLAHLPDTMNINTLADEYAPISGKDCYFVDVDINYNFIVIDPDNHRRYKGSDGPFYFPSVNIEEQRVVKVKLIPLYDFCEVVLE